MENKIAKKMIVGKVVSVGMQKTVTVAVSHEYRHPLYKKAIHRIHKFAVHNELADIKVGDMVKIVETKPISKRKHFKVVEKV